VPARNIAASFLLTETLMTEIKSARSAITARASGVRPRPPASVRKALENDYRRARLHARDKRARATFISRGDQSRRPRPVVYRRLAYQSRLPRCAAYVRVQRLSSDAIDSPDAFAVHPSDARSADASSRSLARGHEQTRARNRAMYAVPTHARSLR